MSESTQRSGRLCGMLPDAPPPPSVAAARSELRGLLATDCQKGRARYDGDASRQWHLDGEFTALPDDVNKEDDSVILDEDFDYGSLFDDSSCGSSIADDDAETEEEEDVWQSDSVTYQSVDDNAVKLIPFPDLKQLIEENCVCKECHSPLELSQETFGLATNVCVRCLPGDKQFADHGDKMWSERLKTNDEYEDDETPDSARNYIINSLLVLAMQQLGLGTVSVATMLGAIGIRHSLGKIRQWNKIQDMVGLAEQAVKEEVLAENVAMAIQKAKDDNANTDDAGRIGLTCSIDAGWQKRSSGRTYDSPSGHNLLVDCRTKRILDCTVYCKHCTICDRRKKDDNANNAGAGDDVVDADVGSNGNDDTANDDNNANDDDDDDDNPKQHRCPKNFTGSSKSMESSGAVELVSKAAKSTTHWVEAIVGDDDSTSRAVLRTDLKQYQQDHPHIPKATYWPRKPDKDGRLKYVPNKGKMHWSLRPPLVFYCNPTHRWRVIGNHLFALQKSTTTGVTKADARRLKRNYGYAHKQSRTKSWEEYRKAMDGALLHHGNDHRYCLASWCPFAAGRKHPKDNDRSVLRTTEKWKNLELIHQKFTTVEMLKMCYHIYDSQKNESVNTKIAAVAPKSKTFSKMMSLADRIAFVVIVDSIGYECGILRIVAKITGRTTMRISPALRLWLKLKDRDMGWRKRHREKPENKQKRAKKAQDKIREEIAAEKKAARTGLDYGSGIAVASKDDDKPASASKEAAAASSLPDPATKKRKADSAVVCSRCGEQGHARVTSRNCRFNSEYLAEKSRKTVGA